MRQTYAAGNETSIQCNLSLQTPLYYGKFVWSQKSQKSYIPYLYKTDTSVKRTIGSVPLVSVLNRFDCNTLGEQGWRSGESTHPPPMWSGFESWRRRHMWAEFVVGSLPCSERFFFGYSGFPLSSKTNTFKFQFDLERTDTFQRVLMNSLVLRG